MNFSVPVKKITQPNYEEGSSLRSVRDSSSNSLQWKKSRTIKSQSLSDNIGLAQLIQRLNKLRRRQLGYQSQQPSYYPFKIYQIGNVSATPTQTSNFQTYGNMTGTTVGSTPVNPGSISSFTYQIRGGYVGYRSLYYFNPFLAGEYELPVSCPCTDNTTLFDSLPTANAGVSIQLSNTADTLIFDPSVTPYVLPQIVLDANYDALGFILASFWIKIIDDPSLGLYGKLYGRMCTSDPADHTLRPTTALPSFTDSSIIPLGIINLANDAPTLSGVEQYQWGNLVNRFAGFSPLFVPPGSLLPNPPSPFGAVTNMRGYWTQDNLSGTVFYQGDTIVDDTAPLGSSSTFFGVWTWLGQTFILGGNTYVDTISNPPSSISTGWRLTGTVYSETPLP